MIPVIYCFTYVFCPYKIVNEELIRSYKGFLHVAVENPHKIRVFKNRKLR